MTTTPRRNFQKGWCPQGESLSTAQRRVNPKVWNRIGESFDPHKPSEKIAAYLSYAFTGLEPKNNDRQGSFGETREGSVDILLTNSAVGAPQVMEVTTTLDTSFQRSYTSISEFENAVMGSYSGAQPWALFLEPGWERMQLVKHLAPAVAAALNEASTAQRTPDGPTALHPCVHARPDTIGSPRRVRVVSKSADAQNLNEPYLDALSTYLATDRTIARKVEKLKREADRLGAERIHLFLGMASLGKKGGLLPSSPSYFTWGTFTAPKPLTDIWLEGGTGELFRWTREDGWIFHSLES